jgi:hypothetical protein
MLNLFYSEEYEFKLENNLQIKAFQKVSSKFLFDRGLNNSLFLSLNTILHYLK